MAQQQSYRVVRVYEGGQEVLVADFGQDAATAHEALQSFERDRIYRGDLNHFFALRGPGLLTESEQRAQQDAAFFAAARQHGLSEPTEQQLHDRDTAERAIAFYFDRAREQDLLERGLTGAA